MWQLRNEEAGFKRWTDVRIVVLDFETTGFIEVREPEQLDEQSVKDWIAMNDPCHVIQVAAQKYDNRQFVDEIYSFVKPSNPARLDLDPKVSSLTGIVRENLEDAPTFAEIKDSLVKFILDSDMVIAYNGMAFDKKVFELEMARIRGSYKKIYHPFFDPFLFNWALKKKTGGKDSIKLLDAAKSRGLAHSRRVVKGEAQAHDAKTDIEMLWELALAMSVEDIKPYTLSKLLTAQQTHRAAHRAQYKE